ncbi:MAG: PAS domain S-box protein [Magnetovibrionaceae bacterium]
MTSCSEVERHVAETTKARERLASELGTLIQHLTTLETKKETLNSVEDRLDSAMEDIATYEAELAHQNRQLKAQYRALDQAHQQLKSSRRRAQAVLEAVSDGVVTIDRSGLIQQTNRAASEIFGYAASEMNGQNVKMLMPETHAAHHDGYIQAYMSTGKAQIIGKPRVLEGKRKDGSLFPMNLTVQPVDLPGADLFTGVVRDLTKQPGPDRGAARLLDELDEGFALLDDKAQIIYCNESYRLLLEGRAGSDELIAGTYKVSGPLGEQLLLRRESVQGGFLDRLEIVGPSIPEVP